MEWDRQSGPAMLSSQVLAGFEFKVKANTSVTRFNSGPFGGLSILSNVPKSFQYQGRALT